MTTDEAARQRHVNLVNYALEPVPVAQVLAEVGFSPCSEGSEVLQAAVQVNGGVLRFTAAPHWFDLWMLSTNGRMGDSIACGERVIKATLPRGQVVLELVKLLRELDRQASVPATWEMGLWYEAHRRDLARVRLELPTAWVEGRSIRAARRWLKQGWLARGCPQGEPLRLSMAPGWLYLEGAAERFACPVVRGWVDPCEVDLEEFVQMPGGALKGAIMAVRTTGDTVTFGTTELRRAA